MSQKRVRREKALHRRAWNFYYDLGKKRSLEKVADHFGKSIQAVKKWSTSFKWAKRIKARDKENASLKPVDVGLDQKTVEQVEAVASTVDGSVDETRESTQGGAKTKPPPRDRDRENRIMVDALKKGAVHAIKEGELVIETISDLTALIRLEGYVTGKEDAGGYGGRENQPYVVIQAMVKELKVNIPVLVEKAEQELKDGHPIIDLPPDTKTVNRGRPKEVSPGRPDRPALPPAK